MKDNLLLGIAYLMLFGLFVAIPGLFNWKATEYVWFSDHGAWGTTWRALLIEPAALTLTLLWWWGAGTLFGLLED